MFLPLFFHLFLSLLDFIFSFFSPHPFFLSPLSHAFAFIFSYFPLLISLLPFLPSPSSTLLSSPLTHSSHHHSHPYSYPHPHPHSYCVCRRKVRALWYPPSSYNTITSTLIKTKPSLKPFRNSKTKYVINFSFFVILQFFISFSLLYLRTFCRFYVIVLHFPSFSSLYYFALS